MNLLDQIREKCGAAIALTRKELEVSTKEDIKWMVHHGRISDGQRKRHKALKKF